VLPRQENKYITLQYEKRLRQRDRIYHIFIILHQSIRLSEYKVYNININTIQ